MPRRAPQPEVNVLYEDTAGVVVQWNKHVIDVSTTNAQRIPVFMAQNDDPTSSACRLDLPPKAARAVRDALTRALVQQDPTDRDRAILGVQEALDA